jgi:hypothetical protein
MESNPTPPEQWVTYVPADRAPVNAVAKPVSDDAYTPHVGCVVQSPATVEGELVYPIDGTAVCESTDDGDAAVTVTAADFSFAK